MRILETTSDVDEQVEALVEETLGWFDNEPRLNTEEFIDRLADAGNYASPPFDIENYDSPAVRKIMRFARDARKDT